MGLSSPSRRCSDTSSSCRSACAPPPPDASYCPILDMWCPNSGTPVRPVGCADVYGRLSGPIPLAQDIPIRPYGELAVARVPPPIRSLTRRPRRAHSPGSTFTSGNQPNSLAIWEGIRSMLVDDPADRQQLDQRQLGRRRRGLPAGDVRVDRLVPFDAPQPAARGGGDRGDDGLALAGLLAPAQQQAAARDHATVEVPHPAAPGPLMLRNRTAPRNRARRSPSLTLPRVTVELFAHQVQAA